MVGVQSLTEIIKQLFQTLQVNTLFPAAVLTLVSFLLCPQDILPTKEIGDGGTTIILFISTIILSNLFAAFNGPIIRFLEGYEHKKNRSVYLLTGWLFYIWARREERKHKKIHYELKTCEEDLQKLRQLRTHFDEKQRQEKQSYRERIIEVDNLIKGVRRRSNDLKAELEHSFASSKILPSSLGNTILAFEHYPMKRYRMDGTVLWPCLLPILEEKKFTQFIYNEKSRLDFLLNSGLACLLIGLEFFLLFVFYTPDYKFLLSLAGMLLLTGFFYVASVFAAKDWGTMVKTAFDLYRYDLHKALHLKPLSDGDLAEERKIWHEVSEFLIYGDPRVFAGFFYLSDVN